MTTTEKPMFPHVIDSTILSTFRSCPQKFFRQYLQHWKPKTKSVHLVAGGAFAAGIETARRVFFEQGRPPAEAAAEGLGALMASYGDFECPADSAKSLERTLGALEFYFENYPLGADGMEPIALPNGRVAIEFSFAEPIPFNHPVTGNPVLYTGRADMVAAFAGGIYPIDEKTTTSLGASWARQWEMRSQFTGYCWAVRELGIKPAGAIVRGVSILKTKYDTQQVPTYRSDYEIDRWLKQTVLDLERMQRAWETDWWDFALDGACTEYGGCPFVQVCKSPNPQMWLDTHFERRVWDPLLRKEVTVEEYEEGWGHNSPGIIKR